MNSPPNWPELAQQLIVAIQSTEHAFEKKRVRKTLFSSEEERHLFALRGERDRYIRAARMAINPTDLSSTSIAIDWRTTVLNLLRAHSIAWEIIWVESASGVPVAIESGQHIEGRHADADRYIDEAIQALAATEERFHGVGWDGREILRLYPPQRPRP